MDQFESDSVGQFQSDKMGQPKSESIDQCDRILHDRDQNPKFLSKLKGKKIQFYTLLRGGKYNEYLRKEVKKELRNNLGSSLKLYFTSNPGLLHERKIIFENIILTIDNSYNNLTIAEPTWEITIAYNKEKSDNWKVKCCKFNEVYG